MRAGSQLEDADTSSPAAFQLVGAWMHRCLHHHPSCPNSSLPTLPTRVLDVGLPDDSTTLRLREGNSERAFYTTLSYRWDQTAAQHFQTTKSNLAAHQEQIDYSMLSQNMKDAVAITGSWVYNIFGLTPFVLYRIHRKIGQPNRAIWPEYIKILFSQ